jgi:cytoskeleton protein RodZ
MFFAGIELGTRACQEDPVASFGERLKREREKRKISLDEIALSTKIGTRMLHALEEEKFDQLPGGIFNKGFVRAYARHVGLDEEQTIADYLEAAGEGVPQRAEPSPEVRILPAREAENSEPGKGLPWGLLAAGLLVLALALSVWSYLKRDRREPGSSEPVRAANPTPPAAKQPAVAPPASPQQRGSAVAQPQSAIGEPTPASAAPPTPSEFSVTIKANDDSWVAITVDGKTVAAASLMASGMTRTIQANREIVIRAGNVGGLEISFNGKKLAPQGVEGEVKTLTFGAEGLVGPPPANKPPSPQT